MCSFWLLTKDAGLMRIGGKEVKKSGEGEGGVDNAKTVRKIEGLQFRSFALLMLSFGR